MNSCVMLRLMRSISEVATISTRSAAVSSKIMPVKEDKAFVESDAEKLAKHVCINYLVEGEEPGPKILPDNEYPEWIFKLDLRPKRELEDMDPEIDGWLYWRTLLDRQHAQEQRIKKLTYKKIHLQNSPALKKMRVWHKYNY